VNQVNQNFAQLDNENIKKVYNGPDGVPRIYIDGTQGIIKVAPEGVNVTTAADSELNFNSAQNTLKVVETGTATIEKPVNTAYTLLEVPYDLSYPPMIMASVASSNFYEPLPAIYFIAENMYMQVKASLDHSAQSIWFELFTPNIVGGNYATALNLPIRYYLLQETAQSS